ncbi:MAG: hypothetical protein ACEQSL_10690 [Sediminibacterium sp.]
MKLRRFATILFLFCLCSTAIAQYTTNPMLNTRWTSFGIGANSSDNLSYQLFASKSKYEETVSTTIRAAYSQELISGKDDSIFFRKNRSLEVGILWGQVWGKNNLFLAASAGMGLTLRLYGDSALQVTNEFVYKAGATIGVPAQIEMGYLSKKGGLSLMFVGNWNFREPFYGALICYTRKLSMK